MTVQHIGKMQKKASLNHLIRCFATPSRPPTVLRQYWLVGEVLYSICVHSSIIIFSAASRCGSRNNPFVQMDIYVLM